MVLHRLRGLGANLAARLGNAALAFAHHATLASMLVVHGKKIRRQNRCNTAFFCPICRRICTGRIVTVSSHHHVYFVTVGRGTRLLEELTCHRCGSVFASPGQFPMHDASSSILLQRAEAEQRACQERPGSANRTACIAATIGALEYELNRAARSGSHESITSVFVLALLVTMVCAIVCWDAYTDGSRTPSARRRSCGGASGSLSRPARSCPRSPTGSLAAAVRSLANAS